jgi:TRAP-type C4-dicarboxylate transport system permease large subunit
VLDALFRSFFDLSPVVFTQGEFRFAASTGSYVAAAAVAVAAALTIYAYRQGHGRPAQRMTLAAIRLAILAIILVCMFRPLLVVRAAVPQQNFLGVLLDDSRSMQIADANGQPRASFVKGEFGATIAGC